MTDIQRALEDAIKENKQLIEQNRSLQQELNAPIYGVWTGEYSDRCMVAVFRDKQKAEKYAQLREDLDEYGSYWVDEYELYDTKVNMASRVVKYYWCNINLEEYTDTYMVYHPTTKQVEEVIKAGYIDEEDFDEIEDYIESNQTEMQIYTKDTYWLKSNSRHPYITGYSVNSYEEAKKIAIEQYQIYTQKDLL